jgi:hypothetical protein
MSTDVSEEGITSFSRVKKSAEQEESVHQEIGFLSRKKV